jgi:hypothetical protein
MEVLPVKMAEVRDLLLSVCVSVVPTTEEPLLIPWTAWPTASGDAAASM